MPKHYIQRDALHSILDIYLDIIYNCILHVVTYVEVQNCDFTGVHPCYDRTDLYFLLIRKRSQLKVNITACIPPSILTLLYLATSKANVTLTIILFNMSHIKGEFVHNR